MNRPHSLCLFLRGKQKKPTEVAFHLRVAHLCACSQKKNGPILPVIFRHQLDTFIIAPVTFINWLSPS